MEFDSKHIAQLLLKWQSGRVQLADNEIKITPNHLDLSRKCQQIYHWLATHLIQTSIRDVNFGDNTSPHWPAKESYCSFILIPLLTLLTGRHCVLIGAPGRGKTSIASIMSVLSGNSPTDIEKNTQHGHPQMTHADLLGSPLPSDLIHAKTQSDIKISWKQWITAEVKIIDEYNRIPTKTQSVLLSLMAEGYAEMYQQTIHCGKSAWFLTANDDLGGGTFQVIDALKDRIDISVRCQAFPPAKMDYLLKRIESTQNTVIPNTLIFAKNELNLIDTEIRKIHFSTQHLEVLGYFINQMDYCQMASRQLEFQNKDSLNLAAKRLHQVCNEDCPLDKQENICSQTEKGVSTRVYLAIIHFAKAVAFFRGNPAVGQDDLRQIIPWILFDKIKANENSDFFLNPEHKILLIDRISWIQQMYDKACYQQAQYAELSSEVKRQTPPITDPLPAQEIQKKCHDLEQLMTDLLQNHEQNAVTHQHLLHIKQYYAALQQVKLSPIHAQ